MVKNRSITLAARPHGIPKPLDFQFAEAPIRPLSPGEVLVRTTYLSMDPYLRPLMNDPALLPSGQPIPGDGVGRVVESLHPAFSAGTFVEGILGWQDYSAVPGHALRKLDPGVAPPSTALGVLGSSGLTAYFGLLYVGRPQPGETVVVSAAAGAVGGTVVQIAKLAGARVIGIVGSEEKVRYVVDELGADAAVDYRSGTDWPSALAASCPNGVDVYFDNVGGPVSDAVFRNLRQKARVAVCGQISEYNEPDPPPGPRLLHSVLERTARVEGFGVIEFADRFAEGLRNLTLWLRYGMLRYRESVVEGLENAPLAFAGMLQGRNIGKQLVKVE